MRGLLVIMAAACLWAACLWAAPATAATVIFQKTGDTSEIGLDLNQDPGAGRYRIALSTSIPVLANLYGQIDNHWDVFRAPPPRPHDEYIDGNSAPLPISPGVRTGTDVFWDFIIPKNTRTFFLSGPDKYANWGVPVGTPLYEDNRWENLFFTLEAWDVNLEQPAAFDYTITWTRVGAVPEPSTWTMMIVGFGLLGSSIRLARSKRNPVLMRGQNG